MTVNFRRWVALGALWLLITAGNSAKSTANDGLKTSRYLGPDDRVSTIQSSVPSGISTPINPLRSLELQGTIETLESRKPYSMASNSRPVELEILNPTDALTLLTRSECRSGSILTLSAETRFIADNQLRIIVDRPSTTTAIVRQAIDFTGQIQELTIELLASCAEQELEIERRLAVPASLAIRSHSVPAISTGFSRPSVVPKKPVRSRNPLKSTGGSNFRVLILETPDAEISSPPYKFFDRSIQDLIEGTKTGCEFFGECNVGECFGNSISESNRAESEKRVDQKNSDRVINHAMSFQSYVATALNRLREMGREAGKRSGAMKSRVPATNAGFTSASPAVDNHSSTMAVFSTLGTMARTAKRVAVPYWDYARTFDLLNGIRSIPQWIFSAMWPEYLGRSVNPYGILL